MIYDHAACPKLKSILISRSPKTCGQCKGVLRFITKSKKHEDVGDSTAYNETMVLYHCSWR